MNFVKLLSINVGLPREVEWRGETVRTSIFKSPVSGRVHVGRLNLDGDYQSDLTVHGGRDKAIYVYPHEHNVYWRELLSDVEFPYGAFGENFTTEGLLEDAVSIGDRLRFGSAEFTVTMPRVPCYKLGIRFGRADMTKLFHHSGRSGYYLSVDQEGEVEAGDSFDFISQNEAGMTIAQIYDVYTAPKPNLDLLRQAIELRELPQAWRSYFRERLDELT